jgi:hypothetical protein
MSALKPNTTAATTRLIGFREGLFLHYRQEMYHLTCSIDDTRFEDFRVGYATTSAVQGLWTYRGVVSQKYVDKGILGMEHNSIVNVMGTDDWYMAYH